MTELTLIFDAVDEATPDPKWAARWNRSWPAFEARFIARGGENEQTQIDCRAAMKRNMSELIAVFNRLVAVAGGSLRAARCLSTLCPRPF